MTAGQLARFPGLPPARGAWQTDGTLALKTDAPLRSDPWIVDPAPDTSDTSARAAVMVTRALLEVLSGLRPASQLSRWTSVSLQEDLERRAPRRPTGRRQHLLRIRLSEPSPGVAEVCALTKDVTRGRIRVMALRLERRGQQWIVTRLQAG
ncbi:MAG TPA: Rv3235 family protein [Frankiaceae bacterium]|jgi:hypothetical protein|nr:Rv3235 family protein [Frankiaceae bacterium]